MIRWEHLDTAAVPGDEQTLRLMRRGAEYSIMLGANELMNSRLCGSEEALATFTWERLKDRPRARFLIGGLGMGFTLRAALAVLPATAHVTVAELVPAVIDWARGPMAALHKGSLDDPRLTLSVVDVGELITPGAGWDAIVLDVDNGPEGLTRAANDSLYDLSGLTAAQAALTPGGILAVWSSAPHRAFSIRLKAAGYAVQEIEVRAVQGKKGKGARHTLWLAKAP